ncbi:MAG: hypothetical protein AAGC64_07180 [Bacteroidota bacterium]
MRRQYLFFILFVHIFSCDPCENCNDPVLFEPTVEMVFINQDSIIVIDSALLVYDSLDSSFSFVNSLLVDLRDSLNEIEDSLALGLIEYQDEKDVLLAAINDSQLDSIFFDSLEIDSNTNVLNDIKSIINSGLIKIDTLFIPETGAFISYENSSTSWPFPLSFEKNFTLYEVLIHDEEFSIELDYETFIALDQERNVLIRAENIRVIDLSDNFITLDSCNENCLDGEATFTFFF